MSATVYLNKIQILADTLASIGQPLCPSEFQSFVINGLDDEYDSLFEAVNNRDEPMRPLVICMRACSPPSNALRPGGLMTSTPMILPMP
jgi:hypothetical protein